MVFHFITWGSSLSYKNEYWNLALFFCSDRKIEIKNIVQKYEENPVWYQSKFNILYNVYQFLTF